MGVEKRDEEKIEEKKERGKNLFLFFYLCNSKTTGTKMKKTTEDNEFALHRVQCVILSFS